MSGQLRTSFMSYNQSHSSKSYSGYGFDVNDYTDAELVKLVNELKEEIRMLKLENEILENTIMRLEPALMHGVYQALEYATSMISSSNISTGSSIKTQSKFVLNESLFYSSKLITSPSRISTRKGESLGKISGTVILGSGPKINILEMAEIVFAEMNNQAKNLKNFRNKVERQHSYLKAQLEEIDIRVGDTEKETKKFKQDVLIDGLDKITQRIPAETWVRFITDWTKRTDSKINKMRLRTSTLNAQYRKLKSQVKLKSELRQSLKPVDFEKLKVENSECSKLIEYKKNQLEELKKITGDANLNLSIHKKALMDKNSYLNKVLMTTKNKEQETVELDKERDLIQIEANILSQELDEIKKIRMTDEIPDVMEYVKVKWIITGLKHSIKFLENRAQIHQIALTTVNKKLQTLMSGLKKDNSNTSM